MESLDGKVIYQVFVRNYQKEGNFKSVKKDLDRIKSLGVDILYLMPINEIGKASRKGTYGSPYAIKDYYAISKDLGTKKDLVELIKATHEKGMKIILDMVFNHTSPDNDLTTKHPDFYYLKEGVPSHRIADWSDVIDLNVEKIETQEYLIDVLRYYVSLGFDGFRFDVASIIPLEFFARARLALGNDIIFFAESVSKDFKVYLKKMHYYYEEDEYLPPTFDILYNYNYLDDFKHYLETRDEEYLRSVMRIINKENVINQEVIRSNGLENHDLDRLASKLSRKELINFTTMFISIRGSAFIYAGGEYGFKHRPDLFEKDPIDWTIKDEELCEYIKELIELKKEFGEIETQYIEEIGQLLVYKITLRNKEGLERKFIVNLSDRTILLEQLMEDLYDDDLLTIIDGMIKNGDIVLDHPLIFTFSLEDKTKEAVQS
ncbi:MAG: alpha-amylase [Bacilli bacterium]|nr:alpha-amylase [Bacilli bacterium]